MYDTELLELRNLYKKGIFEPEFYKNKITCIEQLDDYDAFQSIPFTYKNEIRNTSVEERSTTRPEDIYGIFSSSGTTGEKTYYIYNRNDKRVHEDFVRTFFTELGVTEKDIGGVIGKIEILTNNKLDFENSYAKGTINGTNTNSGGLVGSISSIGDANIVFKALYTTVEI